MGWHCEGDWNSDIRYMYGRISLARAIMDITSWSGFLCFYSRCGEVCSHVAAVLFKVEACVRLKIPTRTCSLVFYN